MPNPNLFATVLIVVVVVVVVVVSRCGIGIGVHLRRRVVSARESTVRAIKEHPESLAATEMDDRTGRRAPSGASGDNGALSCKELEFLQGSHFYRQKKIVGVVECSSSCL